MYMEILQYSITQRIQDFSGIEAKSMVYVIRLMWVQSPLIYLLAVWSSESCLTSLSPINFLLCKIRTITLPNLNELLLFINSKFCIFYILTSLIFGRHITIKSKLQFLRSATIIMMSYNQWP